MTVGFNIGAINLGDCSLALDFLNNSEDYEPEITEVRQDLLGKAPLVHDKPVVKPKITKTSLVHKYAIVNNQEEQDTILNESLVVADTAYEEDIEIDIEDNDNTEFGSAIEKANSIIEDNRIGYEDEEEDIEEEEDAVDKALEDFDFDEDEEESDEEQEIQPVVAQPVISIQEEDEEETEEDEIDEDSLLGDLFDEDEEQDEEEPEPVVSVKAPEVKTVPPQIKVDVPRQVSSVVREVNIDTEEIADETDEEIMLRKQLEEIQRRKREKAEADAIKIAKQKRVLELQKQLEREQQELESEEVINIPISKPKQVVAQAPVSVKQSAPVNRSASEIRHRQYDEMEIDALYIEVKRFLQQNGVEKGMVAASKVVEEFGNNCVQRLKKKSYIITIGKGVTIGR